MFIGRERVFDDATHVLHPLHLAFASCSTEAQGRAPPPQPVQHRPGLGAPAPPPHPCNTGPVWGGPPAPPPQPVQHRTGLVAPAPPPHPVQHRPGLGAPAPGRVHSIVKELLRDTSCSHSPLEAITDPYIVYILIIYVSILIQELYFPHFQAVNIQEAGGLGLAGLFTRHLLVGASFSRHSTVPGLFSKAPLSWHFRAGSVG